MNPLSKHLSIAVVGAPSCGKSYLLYDLIHAFHVLGYRPQQLPLDYPYSSFGSFFYDTFNADTGGMRGTEVYACRPANHYGAHFSRGFGSSLWVNFLNIPGEAFNNLEAVNNYFELRRRIDRVKQGMFWLATYYTPSGQMLRLVLPTREFNFANYPVIPLAGRSRHTEYMRWENIHAVIKQDGYVEQGVRRSVTGKWLMKNLHEVMTDSVLLCLQAGWGMFTGLPEDLTYYEERVFKHFYTLSYCQNATDLIVCDNLLASESSAALSTAVGHYLEQLHDHAPHVYLAFRNADSLLRNGTDDYKRAFASATGQDDIARRNQVYATFISRLLEALESESESLDKDIAEHIHLGVGRSLGFAFRELLSMSLRHSGQQTPDADDKSLPPHVYFTATPIDASLDIYINDPTDVTRFMFDDGQKVKSFAREVNADMARHGCWGSLQLLQDLLAQNNCLPRSVSKIIDSSPVGVQNTVSPGGNNDNT